MEELIERLRDGLVSAETAADALEAQQARITHIEAARATERAATDAAIEQIKRQQVRIAELREALVLAMDGLDEYWASINKAVIAELDRVLKLPDDLSALAAHDAGIKAECAKMLSEQDYEYNRKTNELIARHAAHNAEVRNKVIEECAQGAEQFHDDCYCYKNIDGYELARRMRSLKKEPK